jgi:hypothetical protein
MGGEGKRGPREEGVDVVVLPKSKEKYAQNNENPKGRNDTERDQLSQIKQNWWASS